MAVVERPRVLSPFSHIYPRDNAPLPPPSPPDDAPIVDDDKLLRISRCDPELSDLALNFTYMLRRLEGQAVELRIHATGLADSVVHRRMLTSAETTDGAHDAQWDGRVTVPGALLDQRLPVQHGPGTVEIYADAIYRDDAPFSIRKPTVTIVEFGDACFGPGRAVLLPSLLRSRDQPHEPGRTRAPTPVAVEAVLRFAHDHPDASIFVAGHGASAKLSEARSHNIARYLAGDESGWAADCVAQYEVIDQQHILAWINRRFPEFKCDPGALDNAMGGGDPGRAGRVSLALLPAVRRRAVQQRQLGRRRLAGVLLALRSRRPSAAW